VQWSIASSWGIEYTLGKLLASFLPSAPVQQLFNVTGGLFVTFDVAGKVKKALAHAEAAAEAKQQVSVRFQAS